MGERRTTNMQFSLTKLLLGVGLLIVASLAEPSDFFHEDSVVQEEARPFCTSYGPDDPKVTNQKQYDFKSTDALKNDEFMKLVEKARRNCRPQGGTIKISRGLESRRCLKKGQAYTVCFSSLDPEHVGYKGKRLTKKLRLKKYHYKLVQQGKTEWELRSTRQPYRRAIMIAGARVSQKDGELSDCVGGCNAADNPKEGCTLGHHRGGCFSHDLCSLYVGASGFFASRSCGDEAYDASSGALRVSKHLWTKASKGKRAKANGGFRGNEACYTPNDKW